MHGRLILLGDDELYGDGLREQDPAGDWRACSCDSNDIGAGSCTGRILVGSAGGEGAGETSE